VLLCEDATCLSKFFKKVLQESNYKLEKKKVDEANFTFLSNALPNNMCNDSFIFSEDELRKKTLDEEMGNMLL
jgi:hypothetical protein